MKPDENADIDNELANVSALIGDTEDDLCITRNDAGNAQDFIRRHGANLRFVPQWQRWLYWSGSRWREDMDGEIQRLAMRHSRNLLQESAGIEDEHARKAAAQHAIRLGDFAKIEAMLKLARFDKSVVLRHGRVNSDPMLIGTRDGVIDLRTCLHRAATRDEYVTKEIGVQFDPTATCPRWRKFVNEIFAGDAELVAFVQRAAGYTLTGRIDEQCFLFLHGGGSNGKSTFLDALEFVMGEYARRAGEGLLKLSPNGRDPANEIAELHGVRLCLASELENGMRLNENLIKSVTGDGTLKGRRLYTDPFEFASTAKLWIAGNHKPNISGTDNGIWRRVRLVPFTVQFSGAQKDPGLSKCFQGEEAAGILNWMLEGLRMWQTDGLGTCRAVADAVAEYREDSDTLGQFIEDCTVATGVSDLSHSEVFACYQEWTRDQGMKFTTTSRRLATLLRERGWQGKKTNSGKVWLGRATK